LPIDNAHSDSYGNSGNSNCDSEHNTDAYTDSNSDGHGTTYRDSYRYPDTNANRHANPDCDSHRYTFRHAGPDHTQRTWLQSAGFTDGGPLMGRGDFKQHRRLP
jgi:hypothetical protein